MQSDKEEAERKLLEWVETINATGNGHIEKTANTVMAYRTGILSCYDHHVSNAKVDGLTTKSRCLKESLMDIAMTSISSSDYLPCMTLSLREM